MQQVTGPKAEFASGVTLKDVVFWDMTTSQKTAFFIVTDLKTSNLTLVSHWLSNKNFGCLCVGKLIPEGTLSL
jgi:hypothetical protein